MKKSGQNSWETRHAVLRALRNAAKEAQCGERRGVHEVRLEEADPPGGELEVELPVEGL